MKKGLFRRIKEFFHGQNACYREYCTQQATTKCGYGCCSTCHSIWCDDTCRSARKKTDLKIVPGGWK